MRYKTMIEERDGVVHAEVFEDDEHGSQRRIACRGSSSGLRAVRELARLAAEGALSVEVEPAGGSGTGTGSDTG